MYSHRLFSYGGFYGYQMKRGEATKMYCGRAWKNCFQVSAYVLVRVAHVQRISRLNWVDRMNWRSEFPHVLIQSINIYQITFSLSVICLNVVKMRCVALLNEFLTSSDASARLASSRNGKKIGWQRVWVPGLRRAIFFPVKPPGPREVYSQCCLL